MILMDQNGEKMLCELKLAQYSVHSEKLREQNVISLKFFSIVESEKGYRPLPSNLRILFNAYTSVKVENKNIPNYRFFFTEQEQLEERYNNTVYTTGNYLFNITMYRPLFCIKWVLFIFGK
ncbi:hypothetical protein MKX03_004912 [Papaver bracteatum]|nr:hypothetical protein MKX03_004912 [Papaver bracteatum]